MLTSNEDSQLCARCGGHCCRTRPGIEAPERFVVNADLTASLLAHLASGNWILDEHLGVPYEAGSPAPDPDRLIRYPRPATLQEREQHRLSPLPEHGDCVFLTAAGCRLTFADRPRLCRELVPDVCFECESPWGRRQAALAWLPWQEQVNTVLEQVTQTARTKP